MNQEAFDPQVGDAGEQAAPSEAQAGIESSQGQGVGLQAKSKVNLDELQEFRSYKSTMEQKLAKQRQELEAQKARDTEWQSRYADLERRFIEKLPQQERDSWERQRIEAERDQWRNGYSQVIEHLNRVSQVEQLAQQYGVDQTSLLEAPEPIKAFEIIAESQRARIEELRAETEKLRRQIEARGYAGEEIVDLGSGGSSQASSLQQLYNAAAKKGDVATMDKVVIDASKRGVKLDRFAVFK
jgi:hypothetical protein